MQNGRIFSNTPDSASWKTLFILNFINGLWENFKTIKKPIINNDYINFLKIQINSKIISTFQVTYRGGFMTHGRKIQGMVYNVTEVKKEVFKISYVNIAPHCPFISKATSGKVKCPNSNNVVNEPVPS